MQDKLNLPNKIENNDAVALKPTPEMALELFAAIDSSRQFLRPYLFWVDDIKSAADEEKSIAMFLDNWDKQTSFNYIIFSKTTGKIVGCIDIHNVDYTNHIAYFGYWLKQTETGKGYVSKILQKMEELLFDNNTHRLVIICDVANLPSAAVAERNGYFLESIAKQSLYTYGEFHDAKIYVKLAKA